MGAMSKRRRLANVNVFRTFATLAHKLFRLKKEETETSGRTASEKNPAQVLCEKCVTEEGVFKLKKNGVRRDQGGRLEC